MPSNWYQNRQNSKIAPWGRLDSDNHFNEWCGYTVCFQGLLWSQENLQITFTWPMVSQKFLKPPKQVQVDHENSFFKLIFGWIQPKISLKKEFSWSTCTCFGGFKNFWETIGHVNVICKFSCDHSNPWKQTVYPHHSLKWLSESKRPQGAIFEFCLFWYQFEGILKQK